MDEKEKLSAGELMKALSNEKMNSFNKLGLSYIAIRELVDFMQVLNKHEEDYTDEINIITCRETKLHPADVLSHYIILEAFNFYETFKYLKKIYHNLPNIPSYYPKLVKIRDKLFAHRDTKEEFPLVNDVFELLKELTNVATTEKIVEDVTQNFNLVKSLVINHSN